MPTTAAWDDPAITWDDRRFDWTGAYFNVLIPPGDITITTIAPSPNVGSDTVKEIFA